MEFIKEVLFYTALISGSIAFICLCISAIIRCVCILIDHLKVANVMREAIMLYIKTKRPSLEIKEENINISKSRIERKVK